MTIEQLAFKETEKFSEWMRNKVRSAQYWNNEKMVEGYNRVYNNYLRMELAYGKRRNKE